MNQQWLTTGGFDELIQAVDRFILLQHKKTDYRELYDNLIQILKEKEYNNYGLALRTNSGLRLVKPHEIVFCKAENNYTHFRLSDGVTIVASKTIKEYEEILSEHELVRVHKSYLVNLQYIREYNNSDDSLILINGTMIPVSRRRKHEVPELMREKSLRP